MKKLLFLSFCFCFFTSFLHAQEPALVWAKQMGGTDFEQGRSIAVDAAGNVYTTGYWYGTVDFDPGPGMYNLTALGSNDVFISKLDAIGNFLWAKQIGAVDASASTTSIAVDPAGAVYITGSYYGTVDFDPGPGTFNLLGDAGGLFVLKLNAFGNFNWAKQIGVNQGEGLSMAVDGVGNVYTTGYFSGTADFDPGPETFNLTSTGFGVDYEYDIFVSKLDPAGNFVWAKQMGGTNIDQGFSIAVDATGNVYTTGLFYGTADFDPGPGIYNLTPADYDIFVSKLDAAGNFVWAKQMGGTNTDYATCIAVDAASNVYITGSYGGIADFDPGPGTFNLTDDGTFVSKLNSAGNLVWAKSIGGGTSIGLSITVDAAGSVYTTGLFGGTADFDPGPGTFNLTAVGDNSLYNDIFVSKLDATGNFVWAKQIDALTDYGRSTAVDALGYVYTTGFFSGTADFDSGPGTFNLISAGEDDIFVVKWAQSGFSLCSTPLGVTIPDALALTSGALPNTIYIGYAPASSLTLTAGVSGGTAPYTYAWSNGSSAESITVSPTVTTTYTVNVTDQNGCTGTASKTVNVLDIRGGHKNDKVVICHRPKNKANTLTIGADGVADHLSHGDVLGNCEEMPVVAPVTSKTIGENELRAPFRLKVLPNPSGTYFTLRVESGSTEKLRLRVVDIQGRLIEQKEKLQANQNVTIGSAYRPGIYIAEIIQGETRTRVKLIKTGN